MKTIAICANLPMEDGLWRGKEFGKRFPGSGWMKHMPLIPNAVSGKTTLKWIKELVLPASEVIVIQEENNPEGQELIRLGADARVNYCMESPIYASTYYDNPPKGFKHYLRFAGGTDHLFFPSFDDEDITDPVPWSDRKFLCMVMANKHYSMLGDTTDISKNSKTFDISMKAQLHDYRYQAVDYFHGKPGFSLYGRGWSPFGETECEDKLSTIRNYKFALCFENGSYPGYITEKIIDCLVAGVIPVYHGAPDIEHYIPRNFYIDASKFISFQEMESSLRDYKGIDPEVRIKASQGWLTANASKYNNRVFAKRMLELCE